MSQSQNNILKLVKGPDHRAVYANSTQISTSLFDFTLHFGQVTPPVEQVNGTDLVVTNHTTVFMSPQQAKALLYVLRQYMEQYEIAFGLVQLDQKTPSPTKQ